MSTLEAERSPFSNRQPAVLVAVCFAAGIVLDRFVLPWSWGHWCLSSLVAIGLAANGFRQKDQRLAAICLLVGGMCLGGLRHHAFWSLSTTKDVSRFVTLETRLVRLKGLVTDPPFVKPASPAPFRSVLPQSDTTILTVQCQSLMDKGRFVPVRGKVQVRIRGALSEVKAGDAVDLTGWIALPSPPANPGDFDYGEYLKQHQISCIVRIQQPEALVKLPEEEGSNWIRGIDAVRSRAEGILKRHLSEENAGIATALLLGSRSALPEEVRDAFAVTGMMHVLALSGLHVVILAGLVWFVCRFFQFSPQTATLCTLTAVLALAVVSGGRPPIVRASVLLVIVSLGRLANRQSGANNVLALSAIVILAWNPSNLFDVGTQLSFLAVMGILMSLPWSGIRSDVPLLAPDETQQENRFRDATLAVRGYLRSYLALMIGIWLLTAPLIAARFQIISPIGMLLNLFLVPLVNLVLWAGYCLLAIGGLIPFVGNVLAALVDAGLLILLNLVEWGSRVWLGHVSVAGPPDWWLVSYYLMLSAVYTFRAKMHRPLFTGSVVILSWTALGLAVAARPSSPQGLRTTFLSVGHGSAILVEFPNGKTLLFDAGALDDGERAFEVIRTALWDRGITRLDAIALSHSDLDHVNAVPRLSQEVPVGTVLVAKSFFSSPQAVVPYLIEELKERNIPIRAIGQDDILEFDQSVLVEVKHPDPKKNYRHINANSLAIRFTHAGRSLLLVGDIELDGISDLMANDPGGVDVLQAPHHGSRTANTAELVRWSNPSIVVACTGDVPGRTEELKSLYGPGVRLLTTQDDGAVTVELSPAGELRVVPHLRRGSN